VEYVLLVPRNVTLFLAVKIVSIISKCKAAYDDHMGKQKGNDQKYISEYNCNVDVYPQLTIANFSD
jgi:major membrane immunogen (membrane-anchored lipoprotein)